MLTDFFSVGRESPSPAFFLSSNYFSLIAMLSYVLAILIHFWQKQESTE